MIPSCTSVPPFVTLLAIRNLLSFPTASLYTSALMLGEALYGLAEGDGVHDTCAGTGRLNGRSEQLLGRFIAESPAKRRTRDGILVATKLAAYPWRVTPAQYVQACRCAQPILTTTKSMALLISMHIACTISRLLCHSCRYLLIAGKEK